MCRFLFVCFFLAFPPALHCAFAQKTDTLACDASVQLGKTFCPSCEAWGDTYSPDFTGKLPVDYHFIILDKDNKEIFSSENPDEGWNGKVKPGDQDMTAYAWKLYYRYEKGGTLYACSGEVALIH